MADAETGFAAWHAALPAAGGAIGVSAPAGLGIATVMAGRGQGGAARARLSGLVGAMPPVGSGCVALRPMTIVGTGPDAWLVLRERAPADWADDLAVALDGVASVFDQSSGYAVLRLAGAPAARLLQKGVDIDLHDQAFPPGSAAVTLVAHVGLVVWRLDPASFGVAVFRSLAGSFAHWLDGAAAMAGLTLSRSDPPAEAA